MAMHEATRYGNANVVYRYRDLDALTRRLGGKRAERRPVRIINLSLGYEVVEIVTPSPAQGENAWLVVERLIIKRD